MAYLTQPDYVKYVCSCGQKKTITNLYFCRHCLEIRCGFCICHEVDSHYCANCLENMPSSEARLKKNRCSSCFACPSCFHTLSTRATMARDPAAGDTQTKPLKKMYYLSCFNCRWTSRDVGIPDQPVASGGWPERTNPFTTRFNQLLDYYKAIAQQEKQEKLDKERKKFAIRGKYINLTDKTGLTGAMARNIAGLPSSESSSSTITNFVPSQPRAEVEELPEDYHLQEVNLKQITRMCQRASCPELQAACSSRLAPRPRPLSVKRSQRCRSCDHNLTKPEYNPGSIKFKIELLAFYHMPEVKIISYETIKPGGTSALLLKLSNPTAHEMTLRLLRTEDVPETEEEPGTVERTSERSLDPEKEPSWSASVPRRAAAGVLLPATAGVLLPAAAGVLLPATALLPPAPLTLAQRDDAAEYDDEPPGDADDVILWRKSNKLALRLKVTTEATAEVGSPAYFSFAIQYSYRNTVPPSATAVQPSDHILYTTVLLDLGKVCE